MQTVEKGVAGCGIKQQILIRAHLHAVSRGIVAKCGHKTRAQQTED